LGFDSRDELLSGVLQLLDPSEPNLQPSPEMVPYQPTPVRHILQLIAATAVRQDDVFVDLGSGLGHVPLLVSMVTGAQSLGVEVQAAYVASAQRCAQSLRLSRVEFTAQDARDAYLSHGTMFYLYSPFNGSILAGVLSARRGESMRRAHRHLLPRSLHPQSFERDIEMLLRLLCGLTSSGVPSSQKSRKRNSSSSWH
jgi:hypothetical protein